MFVLKNACRQLKSHPWRTTLMILLSMLVTAWSVCSVALIHDNTVAHTTDYNKLQPSAQLTQITPSLPGDDSSYTDQYVSWTTYNELAADAQNKNMKFQYTVTTSIPMRSTDKLKAITTDSTKDINDQQKTGGNFTLRGFYTQEAQDANAAGSFKVVDGKALNYNTSDLSDINALTGALVSKKLAEQDNLKVGDEITLGTPNDAKTTVTIPIAGIYEYTDDAPAGQGTNAEFAKNDRDNIIYTTYFTVMMHSLDSEEATGWAKADIDVLFTFSSPADYEAFKTTVASYVPKGWHFTSSTIEDYNRSLESSDATVAFIRPALIISLICAAILMIALIAWQLWARINEISYDMMIGITKPRIAWQFMLEVFFETLPGFILGLLIAAFCTDPLATRLASGRTLGVPMSSVGTVAWIGILAILVLACIGIIRMIVFRPAQVLR